MTFEACPSEIAKAISTGGIQLKIDVGVRSCRTSGGPLTTTRCRHSRGDEYAFHIELRGNVTIASDHNQAASKRRTAPSSDEKSSLLRPIAFKTHRPVGKASALSHFRQRAVGMAGSEVQRSASRFPPVIPNALRSDIYGSLFERDSMNASRQHQLQIADQRKGIPYMRSYTTTLFAENRVWVKPSMPFTTVAGAER